MEAAIPYDSQGVYSLPNGSTAVTGQTILATTHNNPTQDIAAALSQVLLRSGVAPLAGNLSAGGFRLTNLANGSADGDSVNMSQLNALAALITNAAPTGAVKGFRSKTAPAGWIKENGGTIGSAASGATTRANPDTEALFTHLWTQFTNTELPIQNSAGVATTRGASAAADFAANKSMPLFDSRTRFHRGADDGLGFDATLTVGVAQADGIKKHKHTGTTAEDTHSHTVPKGADGGGNFAQNGPQGAGTIPTSSYTHDHDFTTNDNTGGLDLETRPRSSTVLYCIKL